MCDVRLGSSEKLVMNIICTNKDITKEELNEILSDRGKKWKDSNVSNFLQSLQRKELINKTRDGKFYRYSPVIEISELNKITVASKKKAIDGNKKNKLYAINSFISRFGDGGITTKETIDELYEFFDYIMKCDEYQRKEMQYELGTKFEKLVYKLLDYIDFQIDLTVVIIGNYWYKQFMQKNT